MRLLPVLIAAGAIAVIGLSPGEAAQQAAKPVAISPAKAKALMHFRHERMETIRDNFKVAGKEVSGSSPDLAKVRNPAETIDKLARQASRWFPAGTGPDVGKTMAKPAVWQDPKDFAAKMATFQKAASTFNAAAKSGNASTAKAAFGDLAKTCKACHDLYRKAL
ncbi:MAG: cytochrome c [Sphingomicrobium sp.]